MPNKRSVVWKYFETVIENESSKCIICNQVISHVSNSTGNLLRHLRRHPHLCPDIVIFPKIKQEEFNTSFRKKTYKGKIIKLRKGEKLPLRRLIDTNIETLPYASPTKTLTINNVKKEEIDKQLLVLITKECHPLSLVEEPEFMKFIKLLCPSYQLPSQKILYSELVSNEYEVIRQEVKQRLQRASSVCIAVEGWSSRNSDYRYYAIIAHYVVGDQTTTTLSSDLLGCVSFTDNHGSKTVYMKINNLLTEWNINEKVIVFVSDNAAIITAVRLGGWNYRGCFAHGINLIVQSGLTDIENVTTKIKTIVEYFLRNSYASELLTAQLEIMNLPIIELKSDVKSRWNSTFLMLQNILTIKEAVISTMSIVNDPLSEIELDGSEIVSLSDCEWQIIEQCVEVLEIFDGVTNVLSSENKPLLASMVIVFFKQIHKHLEVMIKRDNLLPEVKKFCLKLQSLLSRRFENVEDNELTAQSTIIDPRFKKYGFLNERKYQQALNSLYTEISRMDIGLPKDRTQILEDNIETCEREEVVKQRDSLLWKDFDEEVKSHQNTANYYELASAMVEVDGYIEEALLPRQQDPFLWWHQRKTAYPRLYQFMKSRLCVLATIVPGERIFTNYGRTITDRRTLLHDKNMEQTIFLGYNLNNT